MNRRGVVVAGVAVLITLSACTPGEGDGSPSSTATPPPSASATPTPEQTEPAALPALADLVLSPEGLGPLVVGQAPPVVDPASDILIHSMTVCQSAVDLGYRETADMWVANYEPALGGENPSPFGVWVDPASGQLRMLGVYDASIATTMGIHLGSSASEVAAAYPGADLVEEYESGDSHAYRIVGTAGDLYIDVLKAESVPSYPEIGSAEVVRLTVLAKGEAPVGFNSDFVLGLCIGA